MDKPTLSVPDPVLIRCALTGKRVPACCPLTK
jgi:hypothetical protein